ncbi:class I SAM-dependent methyltransferase [Mariniblastus fucicola]|uniref:Ubiquinone/menaquinone biosynthesis C-methyltransferase UbiE n=1 Tax=Mariniblastus fucicola TaxID=980251 RepID=A0A5B9PG91_9BACT|nr:class I SAM-dependent methyltransferase [Mariniblastus fucicola]QEG23782.1 Ubiquinone/menaquinone biosynthesis C-methyltransferase UbiE [Mariniblastus fucicola]
MKKPGFVLLLMFAGSLLFAPTSNAQQTPDPFSDTTGEKAGDTETAADKIPPGVDVYMGRRVAQTMGHQGADWLIRDEREREERCSLMLANLGIKRGMTICDMGCGNGYYSLQMAQLTGKKGYVVGVDVQPEMLSLLRNRMEEQGVENIIPILGSYHNPHLPENMVDLILLVDVYHEFSHPEQMLAAMRKSLKPDGLAVFLEYRKEDPDVPIKLLHKMTKAQVNKELTANGFKLVKEYDKLPWQHMMFFGKDEAWDRAQGDATGAEPQDEAAGSNK